MNRGRMLKHDHDAAHNDRFAMRHCPYQRFGIGGVQNTEELGIFGFVRLSSPSSDEQNANTAWESE